MKEYKSIQELIIKAALYDGVSTTIGPSEFRGTDVIKVIFSRGTQQIATYIDLLDSEEAALYSCKRMLCKLLFAPYEEIEVKKEN